MVSSGNPKPNISLMLLCIIFKTFTQVLLLRSCALLPTQTSWTDSHINPTLGCYVDITQKIQSDNAEHCGPCVYDRCTIACRGKMRGGVREAVKMEAILFQAFQIWISFET